MPPSRTRLRRLRICGYRSIRDVELPPPDSGLTELPDIVVLYGPNGAGKSNLMGAIRLLLDAVSKTDRLAHDRDTSTHWPYDEAAAKIGMSLDDFRLGAAPKLRVEIDLDLGDKIRQRLRAEGFDIKSLSLTGIFEDSGQGIRFWCERAVVDQKLLLTTSPPLEQATAAYSKQQELLQQAHASGASRDEVEHLEGGVMRAKAELGELHRLYAAWQPVAERLRRGVLPTSIQLTSAYRIPGPEIEGQLFDRFLSQDRAERALKGRLASLLRKAGLFGGAPDLTVEPVQSKGGKKQIFVRHPRLGELLLNSLGTGEQQLILLLAERVLTPAPIAHLEEPEAHLHIGLMKPLADVLRESVSPSDGGESDIDQLWIATHHHLFALTPQFFDVSIDPKLGTQVAVRPRSEAQKHFYEPGPYWNALEEMVSGGLSEETVLSIDEDGKAITVGELRASIRGPDRSLADRFVGAALRSVLLSLTRDQA